jgi:hypothetical protein
MMLDFRMRNSALHDREIVVPLSLPKSSLWYWEWVSDTIKKRLVRTIDGSIFSDYKIDKPLLLTYSGGVESILGTRILYSYDQTTFYWNGKDQGSPDPYGTVEAVAALVGAGLGYGCTVVGMEDIAVSNEILDLYKTTEASTVDNLVSEAGRFEFTDDWIINWSKYAYPATVQSVVCVWQKDELLAKAIEKVGWKNILSCKHREKHGPDSDWCGECYKCFCLWTIGKAIGKEPPFKIKRATFDSNLADYRNFLKTGFDPMQNLGIWSRLKERYGFNLETISTEGML